MINRKRLLGLCKKEFAQIYRDPSSILIAFALPIVLLFLFGYGVNLDSNATRLALVTEDSGIHAHRFIQTINASPYLQLVPMTSVALATRKMEGNDVRGIVVIPSDFSATISRGEQPAKIQLITDGSEPNIANLLSNYLQGIIQVWQIHQYQDKSMLFPEIISIIPRYWFNTENNSQHYLIPGSIAIIMTIIGALLTSLVVAREWERGTMEALLATSMTRWEFLLSKIIPYYLLGIAGLAFCVLVAIYIMHIPFRGSFLILFLVSSLFLGSALGLGLLISTITKNQFVAAQAALNAGFLPATMLSGFIFEIDTMPKVLQWFTYLIPAKYFVKALQTIFQAGNIWYIIGINASFLLVSAIFWLGFSAMKTQQQLDK